MAKFKKLKSCLYQKYYAPQNCQYPFLYVSGSNAPYFSPLALTGWNHHGPSQWFQYLNLFSTYYIYAKMTF